MAEQQIQVGAQVLVPGGTRGTVLNARNERWGQEMENGQYSQRDWQYRVDVQGVSGASWFAEEELRVVQIRESR